MRRVFEIGERVWYEDDYEHGWATIALINRQSSIRQQPCSDYDNDILTLVKMDGFSEIETTPSCVYQLAPIGTFRGKDVCWEHQEGSEYPLWCPDEYENCFFFELDK